MMRKMLSGILVFGLIFTTFGLISQSSESRGDDCTILGKVYHSLDDAAEIYNEAGDWSCDNITAYRLVNVTDTAINDGTNDNGSHHEDYDDFSFNAASEWSSWNEDEEAICVGETYDASTGKNYVFITQFTISVSLGISINFCEDTEWEPIPTPIVYAKGDGWINISIPKFTNPVLAPRSKIGTPNADNTIGFAVYRNGTEHIRDTQYWNETHYFYNDTSVSSGTVYHYSVKPIAKGNYTTYGSSLLASSEELSVVLNSPTTGDEIWAGGSSHDIGYTITGGSPPYNVVLSYSTDGGDTYPNTINTTVKQEEGIYLYPWIPNDHGLFDANAVKVKVEVTDDALVSKNDASDNIFVIDSIPPTVESTIPSAGGSVSIKKPITIVFSEKMNKTAAQASFSISSNPGGWVWTWNDAGDTITGAHNDFVFGKTYTATITITAKDLAGNYLAKDYSWNFTANMSVCLNSPSYGDVWTGGVEHGINYTISGGVPDYEAKIYYSYNGGNWSLIAFDNRTEEGTYEYLWEDCPSINSKTVNVKIIIVDANGTESSDTSGNFEIDSIAPFIVAYTGNDTYITTTESIMVVFSEKMNTVLIQSAFSLKDSSGNPVNGTFSWNENVMSFIPNETLTPNMNYSAAVNTNAKDKSDPGNNLDKNYSWSFIAIEGRGDLIVGSPIISPSPEKGKTSTITVTVSNTGDEAFNISGYLTVKFSASRDGKTWTPIATKYIQNIWAGNTSSAVTPFTFDDYGNYYFLVEVSSNNPADTFPGGEKTGRASAYINIPKPAEEIGLGPYTLIALMVVIVVIVGAIILLSLKKKGELTLKEKTKEEKEEEESEEEE